MSIPVGTTFAQAFGFSTRNLSTLVEVAKVPFLLVLVINGAVILFGGEAPSWYIQLAQNFLTVVIQVPFITSWYRFALLPPEVSRPTMGFEYGRAELSFLGYALLAWVSIAGLGVALGMVAGGAMPAPGATPDPAAAGPLLMLMLGGLAGLLLLGLLWARWSMVFPGTSVGAPTSFGLSSQTTQGNVWRILSVMLLIGLCLGGVLLVPALILGVVVQSTGERLVPQLVYTVFGLGVTFYFTAVASSALAFIFQRLTDYDPGTYRPE